MKSFEGKVVAITGAGSGIGRALACAFAERGARLALSDIAAAGLEETAARVRQLGAEVHVALVDVAQRPNVFAWADAVAGHYGGVNVIVNNAGVSLTVAISEMTVEDCEWLMNINFWGVVHGTQAFVPHLIRSGEGHVVNVSSIFGVMAVPTQAAYNAAKFAVRGFTAALRMELQLEGRPVGVTSVLPGGIRTNIARSSRHPDGAGPLFRERERSVREFDTQLARNTPEYCARTILRAVQRNDAELLVGADARLLALATRWLPCKYQSLVVAVLQRKWGLAR